MSYLIPDADALITYVKDFTGSSNDLEIKQCIFLAEMMMRNIELPSLRSDPYDSANIISADSDGKIPIPADMNRPILFFKIGSTSGGSGLGPYIVYDRIGDRDIITQSMLQNLYLKPINIPQVLRGKFSEVAQKYQFLPKLGTGDVINLYYFKSWPLLFSLESDGITTVQNNGVLQSFPEGYVYGTLHNYYLKRKMAEDAAYWRQKYDDAINTVEDQNSKGKWSGGHNRLTSIFQPRTAPRYGLK